MAKTYLERLSESLQTPGAMGIQPDIPSAEERLAIRERAAESRGLSLLDPTGVGGYTLTFAQTEAGQRLAAALALETERISGRERLKLEGTLHSLAMDLLPPKDVDTAMKQVRRGELVKSKLAFQAVLQNLADETEHAERRKDIELAEENERRTLREARARITVDMIGRDIGRAILYALSGGGDE
jgi:hypothetical protein